MLLLENSAFPSLAPRGSCWAWDEQSLQDTKGSSWNKCACLSTWVLCGCHQTCPPVPRLPAGGAQSPSPPYGHGAPPGVGLCQGLSLRRWPRESLGSRTSQKAILWRQVPVLRVPRVLRVLRCGSGSSRRAVVSLETHCLLSSPPPAL